jgi:TonB family protein
MQHKRSFRALYAFALVASLVFSAIQLTEAQALPKQPTPKPPPLRKVHQQTRAQQDADASLSKSGADLVRLEDALGNLPKGNRKLIVRCSRGYYAPEDSGDYIEPMTASLKPTILHKEKPKYTLEAHGHNVQGEVVLSAVFAGDGRIADIRVVCGLPHGLTENAIAAAKKIRFKPAARNGAPVSVRATLIYTFRIL